MTFKKINIKEDLFHYIKLSTSTYVLYDSEMDIPIMYGSKNKVDATVKNLNSKIRINYYVNNKDFIKLDRIYDKRTSEDD